MRVPSATYRLQFSKDFRFSDAQAIVPHLARLGISDIYASPVFQARGGSAHGYDVTNPSQLNPELGTRAEFDALTATLQQHGMGLLIDIVPNHMAVSPENPWWMDVLENGTGSPYSGFFGIDWGVAGTPSSQDEKLYLPILGDPFGRALEWGHLKVGIDQQGLFVSYYSHHLPLDPGTYDLVLNADVPSNLCEADSIEWQQFLEDIRLLPRRVATTWELVERRQRVKEEIKTKLWQFYNGVPTLHQFIDERIKQFNGTPGDAASFTSLEHLIDQQPYRIAYWRTAREKINYRRFFDVTDLISLRAESEQVFEQTHRFALDLYAAGQIIGFRIDHIDGLSDPQEYLQRLRKAAGPEAFIVVEKITLGAEDLPAEWPVQGTTGYDFLAAIEGLFVHPPGLAQIQRAYERFVEVSEDFNTFCYHNKRRVMEQLFRGEVLHLGDALVDLSESERHARDLSPGAIRHALNEVTACLPVYRTYIDSLEVSARDRHVISRALAAARERDSETAYDVYDFVGRVLCLQFPPDLTEPQRKAWLRFIRRWQQLTGPIMAKGVEDTTFYQYNTLLSLNEVGSDLQPLSLTEFHSRQQRHRTEWPHALNASATHDTKRGEDVRARLSVLTELTPEWDRLIRRWTKLNQEKKINGVPQPNEEYFLYQILLGAWPFCDSDLPAFRERLQAYLVKASREAKIHSSWLQPDEGFEHAFQSFANALLDSPPDSLFLQQFREFQQRIALCGAMSSLSRLLLKVTCPGVPDFYQGTGLWDLSLVDPDNRRPVDYAKREQILLDVKSRSIADLLRHWSDGDVKLFLTQALLAFRREHSGLFACGSYEPLAVTGERADNLVAFARRQGDHWIVILAPRFFAQLTVLQSPPVGRRIWRDTRVVLPVDAPSTWHNPITGQVCQGESALTVGDILSQFPIGLLSSQPVSVTNQP